MKRSFQANPFLYGLTCMALFAFASVGLWGFATDLYEGGRPITDLGTTDRNLLLKIDEENHTPLDNLGLNASASFPTVAADPDTKTPYVLTAGNDTWGAWVHLIGSDDMPIRAGKETFDINDLLVQTVSTDSTGRIQVGWDATTSTVILSNETYTSIMFTPEGIGINVGVGHLDIDSPDLDAGTLVWGRCWIFDENAATVSIFIEVHEFDEPPISR